MEVNKQDGVIYNQPKNEEERNKVASDCLKSLKLSIPTLIDNMDDSTEKNYAGWPDRIYIVGKDGKVSYKGDKGPRGFKPGEAESALKKLIGQTEPDKPSQSTDLKGLKLEKDEKNSKEDMEAFRFTYKYSDEKEIKGLLARPSGKGPFPTIVLNHGKGGSAQAIGNSIGSQFIKKGYAYIACDLEPGIKDNIERISMSIRILESLQYVDSKKLSMLGISMGAFATLAACCETDKIKAAAVVAGGLRDSGGYDFSSGIQKIGAAVIIIHGADDKIVKPELAQNLKDALDKNGKTSAIKIFDGVGHSVIKDKREEALALVFEFFDKHLGQNKKEDKK
jgi:dienelactone hydrolase